MRIQVVVGLGTAEAISQPPISKSKNLLVYLKYSETTFHLPSWI